MIHGVSPSKLLGGLHALTIILPCGQKRFTLDGPNNLEGETPWIIQWDKMRI
jgi:hypothetical protein